MLQAKVNSWSGTMIISEPALCQVPHLHSKLWRISLDGVWRKGPSPALVPDRRCASLTGEMKRVKDTCAGLETMANTRGFLFSLPDLVPF